MSNRVNWLGCYREIWLVDFEFRQPDGGLPEPHCMVALEFHTGRIIRLWNDELCSMSSTPFSTGSDVLFVAYLASAELNCFRALGWSIPQRILDLCVEFKNYTNGRQLPHGRGLLGALLYFGLPGIEAVEKENMRQLAIRGAPFTEQEKADLLVYCESDVIALKQLLTVMRSHLEPQASLRGRYMAAVSAMETIGTPIDMTTYQRLLNHWGTVKHRIVERIDSRYGVYNGLTFKMDRFEAWLCRNGIPWTRLDSGRLALDDDTFRQMSKIYPEVSPLHEIRRMFSELKTLHLPVGADGRNRCMLSPFQSKTGRNQPSTTRFIFAPSTWLRGLIKPAEGQAIAYIDYSQQEFAIAAVLSGDEAMMKAYQSGDPYLAFAKQAGAVPLDATKESHKKIRDQFKQCALGVQYGMSDYSLARQLGQPGIVGRQLLQSHKETYPKFWQWSEETSNRGLLGCSLTTVFGWQHHFDHRIQQNPRSLCNFPIQATGAEILRLACSLATEQGIRVCCPVHDAVLIEAPVEAIEGITVKTQEHLAEASKIALRGFELRSDTNIVRYPDRYMDDRGVEMWNEVMRILDEIETEEVFLGQNQVEKTGELKNQNAHR